ncbi:hypothetical protein [Paenibacillus cremeus]|uniref:GNAT family N-acetyltransferase n=1 Tax=Paenibacillus cremeus TaxID=2163881 RepID=A0A559K4E8_9BACL|nr:hypothetical protein [Paenibacillus cremeus]TVY06977.1 hypothetical protein FPZ49_26440 [Paenibacillus cremeus]
MKQWTIADTEQKREAAVRFLCRHAEDLGVPYKWSTILTSIYTAINDNGLLFALDRLGCVRGILAYTISKRSGTEDQTRIEVHLLFLEAGFRAWNSLTEAMSALAAELAERFRANSEIGFYCTPTEKHHSLFSKFASVNNTRLHPCGMLSYYVTSLEQLKYYVARYTSRSLKKQ